MPPGHTLDAVGVSSHAGAGVRYPGRIVRGGAPVIDGTDPLPTAAGQVTSGEITNGPGAPRTTSWDDKHADNDAGLCNVTIAQLDCFAAVPEYDQAAGACSEPDRGGRPATLDMSDPTYNCGASNWHA